MQLPKSIHGLRRAIAKADEIEDIVFELPPAPRHGTLSDRLPWSTELRPSGIAALATALCVAPETDHGKAVIEAVWTELLERRLFLRVEHLGPTTGRLIGPSDDPWERQARMDRWLPNPFNYDEESGQLTWAAFRASCAVRTHHVVPGSAYVLCDPWAAWEEVFAGLAADGAIARWCRDGRLWVFVTKPRICRGKWRRYVRGSQLVEHLDRISTVGSG